MKWREIPKIDAHAHLVTDEFREFFKDDKESCWTYSNKSYFKQIAKEYNVKKFVLQPTNDTYMYQETLTNNNWLASQVKQSNGLFLAFADIQNNGAYILDVAPNHLEIAIKDNGLSGLKIHPNNLNIPFDDLRMVPVLRKAAELKIPVIVHSNPTMVGFHDDCAPDRINKMIQVFPDITFIASHLGGMKWQDALSALTYVDISYILPKLYEIYGKDMTERILKAFGADRLIFGTDFPQVYNTKAKDVYERYCSILDEMNFSDEDMEKIAYKNICKILNIEIYGGTNEYNLQRHIN